jgi:flagellar biosynthesis/type III secretory pathway protein FliH
MGSLARYFEEQGIAKGKAEGKAEGITKGQAEGKREAALSMLSKGLISTWLAGLQKLILQKLNIYKKSV